MRWIFRLFLILVVVVIVAVGGLFLLPKDRLAAIAADQITRATGRQVSLSGDLSPSFYPQLGVKTGPVEIAAADWATKGPLLQAQALSVGVDLRALLSGEVKVRQIEVVDPVITLERDAAGRSSWDNAAVSETAAPSEGTNPASARAFTLDGLTLSNGTLRIEDRQAGVSLALTGIGLTASLPHYQGPLRYELKATFDGQAVGSVGAITQFGAFLEGQTTDVEVSAGIGEAVLSYVGQADMAGTLSGSLTADLTDTDALFGLAGQTAPALPAGIREALRVRGKLDLAFPLIALTGSTLTVGPNTLNGDVVVDLTGKPRITGAFQAGQLDFSALTGDGSQGGGAGAGTGWSQTPIKASGLAAADVILTISASGIDLGATQLGPSRMKAVLENARLSLSSDQIQGFGGTVAGEFVVNNRNGLSVGASLSAKDVILQDMLGDLAGFQRLQGQGQAQLRFLGSGVSMHGIMNALSGDGQVVVGQGALTGIDLVSLFRRGQGTGDNATTIFDALNASFVIQNGVLRNEDLVLSASLFEATGVGEVDLGDRAMDYQITPRVFEGQSGGIAVPVRLKGPWSDLSIYPDLEAVAEQELAREREKLEQRLAEERERLAEEARQRAAEEASQALGVELEDGQDLGDAVEQKLEDELRKGLEGLLGGN